jgi:hypothetical protein
MPRPYQRACSTFVQMLPKKRRAHETLHALNTPPTHQIRDVTAPSWFATHPLQSVHRKRADLMCPSTQLAAGAKSPCERLLASERMLADRLGSRIHRAYITPKARWLGLLLEIVRWIRWRRHRTRTCVRCQPQPCKSLTASAVDEPDACVPMRILRRALA